ncbi:hypothetical protein G9A89_017589 [Geosiphon pyriformis]|nr:hypothetical protein G9A89_017589 [Geosiphon pyriformis]
MYPPSSLQSFVFQNHIYSNHSPITGVANHNYQQASNWPNIEFQNHPTWLGQDIQNSSQNPQFLLYDSHNIPHEREQRQVFLHHQYPNAQGLQSIFGYQTPPAPTPSPYIEAGPILYSTKKPTIRDTQNDIAFDQKNVTSSSLGLANTKTRNETIKHMSKESDEKKTKLETKKRTLVHSNAHLTANEIEPKKSYFKDDRKLFTQKKMGNTIKINLGTRVDRLKLGYTPNNIGTKIQEDNQNQDFGFKKRIKLEMVIYDEEKNKEQVLSSEPKKLPEDRPIVDHRKKLFNSDQLTISSNKNQNKTEELLSNNGRSNSPKIGSPEDQVESHIDNKGNTVMFGSTHPDEQRTDEPLLPVQSLGSGTSYHVKKLCELNEPLFFRASQNPTFSQPPIIVDSNIKICSMKIDDGPSVEILGFPMFMKQVRLENPQQNFAPDYPDLPSKPLDVLMKTPSVEDIVTNPSTSIQQNINIRPSFHFLHDETSVSGEDDKVEISQISVEDSFEAGEFKLRKINISMGIEDDRIKAVCSDEGSQQIGDIEGNHNESYPIDNLKCSKSTLFISKEDSGKVFKLGLSENFKPKELDEKPQTPPELDILEISLKPEIKKPDQPEIITSKIISSSVFDFMDSDGSDLTSLSDLDSSASENTDSTSNLDRGIEVVEKASQIKKKESSNPRNNQIKNSQLAVNTLSIRKKSNEQQRVPTTKNCESCNKAHENIEKIGAFQLCPKCIPLFAPELTRVKSMSHSYELNHKVEVLSFDKLWYPGKIVKVEKTKVKVHYDGWGQEYDEWLRVDSQRLRMSIHDNNIQKMYNNQENSRSQLETNAEVYDVGMDKEANKEVDKGKSKRKQISKKSSSSNKHNINNSLSNSVENIQFDTLSISKQSTSLSETEPQRRNKGVLKVRRKTSNIEDDESLYFSKKHPKLVQKVCESCNVLHLNVQRVGSLELCSYCRSLFGDDLGSRSRRGGQYGFELYKRVKVLCLDGNWYTGMMMDIQNSRIRVHYDGWDAKFDEWIPAESSRLREMTLEEILDSQRGAQLDIEEPQYQTDSSDSEMVEDDYLIIAPKSRGKALREKIKSPLHHKGRNPPRTKPRFSLQNYEPVEGSSDDSDTKSRQSTLEYSSTFDWRELYVRRSSRQAVREGKSKNRFDEDTSTDLHELKARFRAGAKVEARDAFKEWHSARVVEAKGYRVLIHYDNSSSVYDEWIDMNSQRLRGGYVEGATSAESDELESLLSAANRTKKTKKNSKFDEIASNIEYVIDGKVYGNDSDRGNWFIYCNQCNVIIKQYRYYCTYCESPSEGNDYKSFELCIWCFAHNFPEDHQHPRCSFAVQSVLGDGVPNLSSKGELISTFEKDEFDTTFKDKNSKLLNELVPPESDMGYLYLKAWSARKICGFCNDDENERLGGFIGPHPFASSAASRHGERKKIFWAHYACAKYSPEVVQTKNNEWYNVTIAWRRGRSMKCGKCKERGATIGCFEPKCNRSFHLACTGKPLSHFEIGVIFYCPSHEAIHNKIEEYNECFRCDVCSAELQEEEAWWSCSPCAEKFFTTFDLCSKCFPECFPDEHEHSKDEFRETSLRKIQEEESSKRAAITLNKEKAKSENASRRKPKSTFKKRENGSQVQCSYCWSEESSRWRKGYNGVLMCEDCFELALVNNPTDESQFGKEKYVASIEDYTHTPYLTRTSVSGVKFDYSQSQALYLDSYEPAENQLFSLPFDSSYFDIPGRAPRWATHSGTDYHGTWLPQTVRRALLRYTKKNERILSNFLGRGTDAIECFLLSRRGVGVDINPAAVALSQRNCSFAIPPGRGTTAEHRPIILQADSRQLSGRLFEDESFDHILSHPPYKNCVEYSTHIDGDLSRFANSAEFNMEMSKVVDESWRLLKPGKRVTLGIGDNREQCFYVPVSFQLIRQYMDRGFELEELIVKRQRYCQAFGLGTYLCVQYDFLMFTHEFIATLKKVDLRNNDSMMLTPDHSTIQENVTFSRTWREIPTVPIARKSVVMGTTWTFKPSPRHDFVLLCTSRMVERFGRDLANWEEIKLNFNALLKTNHKQDVKLKEDEETLDSELDGLSEYEKIRQKRIQENQKMLLSLGLISDLSESSDDISHVEKLLASKPLPPPTPTALIVVPHIPNGTLNVENIPAYRTAITHLAREAHNNLPPSGFLIVGAQDFRSPEGKLWPLSMIFMEDINRAVGGDVMPLKELVITVPEGHAKDKRKICSYEEYVDEKAIADGGNVDHLPIVHACYLIFMKLR